MATQAFPPTPAQAPPAGAKPSPVGTAVSGAQPDMGQIVKQVSAGMQALGALAKIVGEQKPQAAQKFTQCIATFQEGVAILKGGVSPGPTSPQGAVPPPPQMAAESPTPETPEAT
jgi:hypothetical protein